MLLPVQQHAARILDQVDGNRVTIIIGATGCGKSTQIPKMLRSHLKGRVLCVQPRRMATGAVASRVAEELCEPLGGLVVGYHIGAACLAFIDRTEVLFVTAGIFLKQLKSHGAAALANFAAVVIDEVHERSCEIAPTVHITVGINQFADWGILAAAQDAFLKLEAVHHFDPASYQGYTPRRNDRDDPFEVGGVEVRTYAFSLQLARVHAADEALREQEVASKGIFVVAQDHRADLF